MKGFGDSYMRSGSCPDRRGESERRNGFAVWVVQESHVQWRAFAECVRGNVHEDSFQPGSFCQFDIAEDCGRGVRRLAAGWLGCPGDQRRVARRWRPGGVAAAASACGPAWRTVRTALCASLDQQGGFGGGVEERGGGVVSLHGGHRHHVSDGQLRGWGLRIIVAWWLRIPPLPLTRMTLLSATWRSPPSRRAWMTASMRGVMPTR